MEVLGKLTVKNETKEFGSNGFKKREFVITTEDSQYPQVILIECIQDKCDLLDKFNVGDNIKVSYNLNGRIWVNPQGETKYFNSIQGWRIEAVSNESEPAAPQQTQEVDDPLPF